ncbi:hypothetical protein ABTI56_18730, partial [Acinetobacter baumannii]
ELKKVPLPKYKTFKSLIYIEVIIRYRPCGAVDQSLGWHAGGPGFDPQCKSVFFFLPKITLALQVGLEVPLASTKLYALWYGIFG